VEEDIVEIQRHREERRSQSTVKQIYDKANRARI
jgi:hypothetical protein